MSRIESDDIEVGQRVTVLEWKPHTQQVHDFFGGGGVQTITRHDNSGVGDVFEVVAVDRPFVALRKLVCKYIGKVGPHEPRSWTVDTRECSLKRLSPEFVAALLPTATPASVNPSVEGGGL